MKLWWKVSLIAIIIVILATSICSLVMLVRFGQSNIELAIQNTLTDQQMRAASWSAAMENEINTKYDSTPQRSLAHYLMRKFADENTILLSNDDFIYNTTQINPKEFLPIKGNAQQYIIQDIGDRTILFVGSHHRINETPYNLYVIKDLSSVYAGIQGLTYQFSLINFIVILITGAIIILLVRLVLRPISTLKQNTGLIAAGIYDKRIGIIENDEIGELAQDFNSMAAAIEDHVRELQDEADRRTLFMSALTHELKTPMTSISGNAQTLLWTKMDEEEREDALLRIDAECIRIERLSQKLMKLIVLRQKDSIALEAYRVSDLLESVRLSSAEQLRKAGLTLIIYNTMDTLVMDKDLLSSLLLNLIDNARKASSPGDTIELSAEGNSITVRDHGKGIPPEELNKITQPFYMVDKSRSKKAGGIGLGLTLVDEIARLHGARLIFESTLGEGTRVKVVFECV